MKYFLISSLFFAFIITGCEKGENIVSVTKIIDGDTFEGFENYQQYSRKTYRLIGINTPEKNQYGYDLATNQLRNYLRGSCYGKLKITTTGKGIYGRDLVYVYCLGESINEKMISSGYAMSYIKYPHKYTKRYNKLHVEARQSRRGLWGLGYFKEYR